MFGAYRSYSSQGKVAKVPPPYPPTLAIPLPTYAPDTHILLRPRSHLSTHAPDAPMRVCLPIRNAPYPPTLPVQDVRYCDSLCHESRYKHSRSSSTAPACLYHSLHRRTTCAAMCGTGTAYAALVWY
eukprot:886079-Rhodomonas_salina.3